MRVAMVLTKVDFPAAVRSEDRQHFARWSYEIQAIEAVIFPNLTVRPVASRRGAAAVTVLMSPGRPLSASIPEPRSSGWSCGLSSLDGRAGCPPIRSVAYRLV